MVDTKDGENAARSADLNRGHYNDDLKSLEQRTYRLVKWTLVAAVAAVCLSIIGICHNDRWRSGNSWCGGRIRLIRGRDLLDRRRQRRVLNRRGRDQAEQAAGG
jgi:hypothetical protein